MGADAETTDAIIDEIKTSFYIGQTPYYSGLTSPSECATLCEPRSERAHEFNNQRRQQGQFAQAPHGNVRTEYHRADGTFKKKVWH